MTLLRKYRATAQMAATAYMSDSRYFLADYLLRFLRVALLLSIWRTLLAGRGPVSGLTMGAVLTYTLIAEAFGEQLACRAGIEDAFWEGTVVTRFLRPMGAVGQFAAEMAGRMDIVMLQDQHIRASLELQRVVMLKQQEEQASQLAQSSGPGGIPSGILGPTPPPAPPAQGGTP